MFNTLKSSTEDNKNNLKRSHQKPQNSAELLNKEKLVIFQRKEKLKNLLITKFMKKYGLKYPEAIIEKEISKFLMDEKLSDEDIKNLDNKLKEILTKKGLGDDKGKITKLNYKKFK